MHGWLVAAAFTALLCVGGVYETFALRFRRPWLPSITDFTSEHPHFAIIVGGALFMLFGYALGRGGA